MAKKDLTKKEQITIKNDIVENIKEQVLYDIDKEIKNNIKAKTEDYKKEIKETLISEINDEINLAIKREEKRFIRGKNIALFKKNVIILILLAVIGYFGYCLYDVKYFKFMQNYAENVAIEPVIDKENSEKNEVIKDEQWYLDNYSYLLNTAHITLNNDNINAYYLYSQDHDIKDIRNAYLLNMAYKNLPENAIKTSSSTITISGEDLNNAFQKTFYDLEYTPTNFTYDCLNFTYNESKNRYNAENTQCLPANNEIVETIDKIYEEDQNIYIETYATLYNNEEKNCYAFDDLFTPVVTNIEKEQIAENSKKLNKYQYVYELIDNIYYLKNINKLK